MVAINENAQTVKDLEQEIRMLKITMIAVLGALCEGEYKDAEAILAFVLRAKKKDDDN